MKRLVFIAFIVAFCPVILLGQTTLSIEIVGLRNSKGKVLLEFANEKGEKLSGFSQAIVAGKCVITITDLKPGKYSFKYFHDENNNLKLDTNLIGIPKEGYGFANNAKGKFGPPPLEKTIINVQANSTLKCNIIYF